MLVRTAVIRVVEEMAHAGIEEASLHLAWAEIPEVCLV